MKLGQLIEHIKINVFLQKLSENEEGQTSRRPFFIFLKKPNMM